MIVLSLLFVEFVDAPAEKIGQECLGPVLQLPPRHWQLHGCNDGLKVQPEGIALLVETTCDYQEDW